MIRYRLSEPQPHEIKIQELRLERKAEQRHLGKLKEGLKAKMPSTSVENQPTAKSA